jgi:2-dehydro-3-deoxygluconokinase
MSDRPFDLLSLGELLLRLSPAGVERLVRGDSFQKQVGGAELNVAVGAALLGLHTGVVTQLPSRAAAPYRHTQAKGPS